MMGKQLTRRRAQQFLDCKKGASNYLLFDLICVGRKGFRFTVFVSSIFEFYEHDRSNTGFLLAFSEKGCVQDGYGEEE